MTDPTAIVEAARQFILARYLPGEDPSRLTATTPLITGGILDSLSTLEVVAFLENAIGVEFQAHEVHRERLDSLASMTELVRRKLERDR